LISIIIRRYVEFSQRKSKIKYEILIFFFVTIKDFVDLLLYFFVPLERLHTHTYPYIFLRLKFDRMRSNRNNRTRLIFSLYWLLMGTYVYIFIDTKTRVWLMWITLHRWSNHINRHIHF